MNIPPASNRALRYINLFFYVHTMSLYVKNFFSLKHFVCVRSSVMLFLAHLGPQLQPSDAHTIYG